MLLQSDIQSAFMGSITLSPKGCSYLHTREFAIGVLSVVIWAVNDMRSC